ncbi:TetR/AcrR family transcriptional regulator [Deinococcus alpinitundrae]|uniref:TetR/AcrR family transcriptional regulator n=1 Tax=Deinococcus alpinitundrae TaxID=468913 RepID=UPI00137B3BEB|nr:TetR/AcrR family transcriptional regulator [Deinococcus alpinitundrae]
MQTNSSKLETVRQTGATQVDAQRINILNAAERVFLKKGLEASTMANIAEEAEINRVTLYRYFGDRDTLSFEIAVRMLERLAAHPFTSTSQTGSDAQQRLYALKGRAQTMIRDFETLRDAYRYLGMFDHLYGDHYPSTELAAWYREQVQRVVSLSRLNTGDFPYASVVVAYNTILAFLQQMAARGELLAEEQGVPLDEQLRVFHNMIGLYLDHLRASLPAQGPARKE